MGGVGFWVGNCAWRDRIGVNLGEENEIKSRVWDLMNALCGCC